MILYLVASDHATGRLHALDQGWTQIAANRFVALADDGVTKHDIRVVKHFHELVPLPTGIRIICGPDFDEHHDKHKIEALVSIGGAQWHNGAV